jgi:putative ABC transport system permease protein
MGLTRRQLRGTLALEAGMLAAVAGVLGVALGSCYAWVAVRAVVGEVIDDTRLVLPVGQLALIIVVTSVAGLVACLLPARRAAAVTPAQGLTAD